MTNTIETHSDSDVNAWLRRSDDGDVFAIPGTTRGVSSPAVSLAEAIVAMVKAGWLTELNPLTLSFDQLDQLSQNDIAALRKEHGLRTVAYADHAEIVASEIT